MMIFISNKSFYPIIIGLFAATSYITLSVVEGCPYLKSHNTNEVEQEQYQANRKLIEHNPHDFDIDRNDHHYDGGNNNRRKLQQGFDIGAFFRQIIDFILSLFGLGGGGGGGGGNGGNNVDIDPTPLTGLTTAQALDGARNDIEDILTNDRTAEFVRLAFHDCVGGLCDGCVDLNNIDNRGLLDPIEDLQPIVSRYSETLSRADVWVLAGLVAAEEAQGECNNNNNNNPVSFDMEYVGRPVCSDPQGGPDHQLPSAHLTTQQVLDFFSDNFGFNDRETTAILGAHTLGRAVPQNSGFDGRDGWVNNRDCLDNQFYRVLLDNGQVDNDFEQELQNNNDRPEFPNQFLWRQGNDDEFMLNADMALAKNFAGFIDPTSGSVSCNLSNCPNSPLLSTAAEFAANNGVWVNAFHDAFIKMTSIGCDGTTTCTSV